MKKIFYFIFILSVICSCTKYVDVPVEKEIEIPFVPQSLSAGVLNKVEPYTTLGETIYVFGFPWKFINTPIQSVDTDDESLISYVGNYSVGFTSGVITGTHKFKLNLFRNASYEVTIENGEVSYRQLSDILSEKELLTQYGFYFRVNSDSSWQFNYIDNLTFDSYVLSYEATYHKGYIPGNIEYFFTMDPYNVSVSDIRNIRFVNGYGVYNFLPEDNVVYLTDLGFWKETCDMVIDFKGKDESLTTTFKSDNKSRSFGCFSGEFIWLDVIKTSNDFDVLMRPGMEVWAIRYQKNLSTTISSEIIDGEERQILHIHRTGEGKALLYAFYYDGRGVYSGTMDTDLDNVNSLIKVYDDGIIKYNTSVIEKIEVSNDSGVIDNSEFKAPGQDLVKLSIITDNVLTTLSSEQVSDPMSLVQKDVRPFVTVTVSDPINTITYIKNETTTWNYRDFKVWKYFSTEYSDLEDCVPYEALYEDKKALIVSYQSSGYLYADAEVYKGDAEFKALSWMPSITYSNGKAHYVGNPDGFPALTNTKVTIDGVDYYFFCNNKGVATLIKGTYIAPNTSNPPMFKFRGSDVYAYQNHDFRVVSSNKVYLVTFKWDFNEIVNSEYWNYLLKSGQAIQSQEYDSETEKYHNYCGIKIPLIDTDLRFDGYTYSRGINDAMYRSKGYASSYRSEGSYAVINVDNYFRPLKVTQASFYTAGHTESLNSGTIQVN